MLLCWLVVTWEADLQLGELALGEDAEPLMFSVNQEKGTKGGPEDLDGLSEGSLRVRLGQSLHKDRNSVSIKGDRDPLLSLAARVTHSMEML